MEQSQRRIEVMVGLRARVLAAVAQKLDDRFVLQMAMASALREPEDLLGMLFSTHLTKMVMKRKDDVALTHAEWTDLFGHTPGPLRDSGLSHVIQSTEFQPCVQAIGSALRTTISEEQQSRAWARPWCQALCYVGMHMDDPHKSIETVIGQVVKSDLRRIEDLHSRIDDAGYATMLMSKVVISLAAGIL